MKAAFLRFSKTLICTVIFSQIAMVSFAQTTLTNGLVSYWSMDSSVGTNTPDLALSNSLWEFSSPSLVASTVPTHASGNCFQFNGTSQFLGLIHTTNSSATGLPVYSTNGYTVALWVNGNSTQAANKTVFSVGNLNNSGLLLNLATQGSKFRVFIRNNAGTTVINNAISGAVVFDNTWHHVAWVDVNGAGKLYIDGVQDTPSSAATYNYTLPPAGVPTGTDTSIGALYRATPVNFFTGFVDEVMCWNRALSQAEIQSAMSSGIPGPILATPPTVIHQPVSRTNSMGDMASFSADIFGNQPMSFQWLSNGVPLLGQTNNTLTLTSLTAPGTNLFSLTASNSAGTNITSAASLVVLPDPAPNLVSGMVSYWPMDTISNSISTPDLVSQNDFQLTAVSGTNVVAGEFGNALAFDGATQFGAETTGTPIYDVSTTYTVALWVKGSSTGKPNEVVFANAQTNGNFFVIGPDNTGNSGRVDMRVNPGMSDTYSTGTAFDGNWHHIAWVDQNGSGLLYIDGVLDKTPFNYGHGALGSVSLSNTTVAVLAANGVRDFYAGAVDDVGTWNRRLSYTEIQSIFTSGIPAPPVIVKPSISAITTQPASFSNNVFQGDTVSLTASVSGTAPFGYQWESNGVPITGNATATTNTLVLSNVQPGNSAGYSLVVTNVGGAATSSVVQLSVIPYTPVTNGTALQVEFNPVLGAIVQPGFSSMSLATNPARFNGPQVTLSTVGSTSLADRLRAVPTNNPPALTQANIYQQIIFSTANSAGTGVDILITKLAPNTTYGLTLWSWDSQNSGQSTWYDATSGSPVAFPYFPGNNSVYFFSSGTPPKADYDNTLGALLTSSPTGTLEIQGLQNGATLSIFINALRLVANPTIQVTSATVATDGNLQLTIATQFPAQPIHILESPDLSPGSWQTASDGTVTATHGPIVTMEFPMNASQLFYRAVSP